MALTSRFKKIVLTLLFFPLSGMALQNSIALSYGSDLGSLGEPSGVMGGNIAYLLQPDSWQWGHFSLGLNFSYGFWKTTDYADHQTISTYAIAPVLRWYFLNNSMATPFLQGSVGGAVLSSQYFGDRNLGTSILFQDQGGIGLAFGASKDVFATMEAIHYSNCGMNDQNGGLTVPLFLTVGTRF
jgi:hypothetical protein